MWTRCGIESTTWYQTGIVRTRPKVLPSAVLQSCLHGTPDGGIPSDLIMIESQWRQQGGHPQQNVSPLKCSKLQYLYVCMYLYLLNLSYFVLFQPKTANFRALCAISSISHNTNQFKLKNCILKRFLSSKGANFAAHFVRIRHLYH